MPLILLEFIRKPSNLIIVGLASLLVFCFVNSQLKDLKINTLKSDILNIEISLAKCENDKDIMAKNYEENLRVLKHEIDAFNEEILKWKQIIESKNEQLAKESNRVDYWKDKFVNKICVNNDGEVVRPTKGVINEDQNKVVISNINSMFSSNR